MKPDSSGCGCGCLGGSGEIKVSKIQDLTGKRFGCLVAVRATDKRSKRSVVWECRCDCGNQKEVPARHLAGRGHTKSCGCMAYNCMKAGAKKGTRISALKRRIYPPELYLLHKSKRNVMFLTNSYVKNKLYSQGYDNNQIPPEVIELKRELLQMGRLERRLDGLISARNQRTTDVDKTV